MNWFPSGYIHNHFLPKMLWVWVYINTCTSYKKSSGITYIHIEGNQGREGLREGFATLSSPQSSLSVCIEKQYLPRTCHWKTYIALEQNQNFRNNSKSSKYRNLTCKDLPCITDFHIFWTVLFLHWVIPIHTKSPKTNMKPSLSAIMPLL